MSKNRCECEMSREKSFSQKVFETAIDTSTKVAVAYLVGSAVTVVAGPVAGFVAAKIATGGISGPEDLV